MNFYKHYIGDFQRDTGHLSLTQRGAYLCLMHHYYATERPLPNDHGALCRIVGAIERQEREAVRVVMAFFEPVESGLMHSRIEVELQKAGEVSSTNRDIALAREAKRRLARTEHEQSTKRAPSVPRTEHEQSTPQTPDTRLQTTVKTKAARKRAAPPECPPGVDGQVWSDWLALRAKKRAPVTATVMDGVSAEAAKARMSVEAFLRVWCSRGSQGLMADWLKPNERQATAPTETAYARQMREKYEQVCPDIAAKRPGSAAPYTVDMEAPNAVAIR